MDDMLQRGKNLRTLDSKMNFCRSGTPYRLGSSSASEGMTALCRASLGHKLAGSLQADLPTIRCGFGMLQPDSNYSAAGDITILLNALLGPPFRIWSQVDHLIKPSEFGMGRRGRNYAAFRGTKALSIVSNGLQTARSLPAVPATTRFAFGILKRER